MPLSDSSSAVFLLTVLLSKPMANNLFTPIKDVSKIILLVLVFPPWSAIVDTVSILLLYSFQVTNRSKPSLNNLANLLLFSVLKVFLVSQM